MPRVALPCFPCDSADPKLFFAAFGFSGFLGLLPDLHYTLFCVLFCTLSRFRRLAIAASFAITSFAPLIGRAAQQSRVDFGFGGVRGGCSNLCHRPPTAPLPTPPNTAYSLLFWGGLKIKSSVSLTPNNKKEYPLLCIGCSGATCGGWGCAVLRLHSSSRAA